MRGKIGLAGLVRRGDVVAVDGLRGDIVMRVDQDRVACNTRDLGVGDGLGARRLGRNRKDSSSKKSDGSERAESAQGSPFKTGFSE